jgi:hypothetical protein
MDALHVTLALFAAWCFGMWWTARKDRDYHEARAKEYQDLYDDAVWRLNKLLPPPRQTNGWRGD